MYDFCFILIKIHLEFVPWGPSKGMLVWMMAWWWAADKPLSDPTSDNYLYHFKNSDLYQVTLGATFKAMATIAHMVFTLNYMKSTISELSWLSGRQLIWTITPGGYANNGNLYIGIYWWTVSQ